MPAPTPTPTPGVYTAPCDASDDHQQIDFVPVPVGSTLPPSRAATDARQVGLLRNRGSGLCVDSLGASRRYPLAWTRCANSSDGGSSSQTWQKNVDGSFSQILPTDLPRHLSVGVAVASSNVVCLDSFGKPTGTPPRYNVGVFPCYAKPDAKQVWSLTADGGLSDAYDQRCVTVIP